jgi:hypothetical protein
MEEGEEVCDPSRVKKNINFDEVNPSRATDAKTLDMNTLEVPPPPPTYSDPWDCLKYERRLLQMTWQHRRPPTRRTAGPNNDIKLERAWLRAGCDRSITSLPSADIRALLSLHL